MTFNLQINIDSESPEGHVLEDIVNRDHISPEEAVLQLLRERSGISPAREMLGAFADTDDPAMLAEIVQEAYQQRLLNQPREYGF